MNKNNKGHKRKLAGIIILLLLCGLILGGVKAYRIYNYIKAPNVKINEGDVGYLYIPNGITYNSLLAILNKNEVLISEESFRWVAEKKKYPNNVKAGRYRIVNGMDNNSLINLLRSGRQEPVDLVFNKIRTKDKFAGIIAQQIQADSIEILDLLNSKQFLSKYNVDLNTALCIFIPNTYEFFWNTSAEKFVGRMAVEHDRFWNEKRLAKAKKLKLTEFEVYILASIVEEETTKNDEKKRLAGVYYNRIEKRMRLQADPTVKYALGDFNIKRVLNKHLEYDSPYNTYRVYGLPPGPICIPSISSIDAVLSLEHHNYLYFCAKDDFSGYHAFAKTLRQHNANAEKYRRALNRNRIYR